ncbi:MAG: cold shock domain-containing protein [Actinomycetaceae bacterium]|nr:cold shock domain-containing protein [Actinomycetaceae bacterium]MDY6082715.1 cold shock domain-containing protein [Actinomycetaceae bacterium]
MPVGKVKFFDEHKGFGFIAGENGDQVYVPAASVPLGVRLKAGMRVEYAVAQTRRGTQALDVKPVAKIESLAKKQRRSPQDMVVLVEDLLQILDHASEQLRKGHYPKEGHRVAEALRTLADDFDA